MSGATGRELEHHVAMSKLAEALVAPWPLDGFLAARKHCRTVSRYLYWPRKQAEDVSRLNVLTGSALEHI